MAVYVLTTDTDLFLGSINDDQFVGIPNINIGGTDYSGEMGGADVVTGDIGNDHFHLGAVSSGSFDGGADTDTVFAYGDIGFFVTFTNFEVFSVQTTADPVGIAASQLNLFGTINGQTYPDGRIHLSVGINADVDFGARMNGGDGIDVLVDDSINGTFEIEGTQYSDNFVVDETDANAVISYFGNDGADFFQTDNDGGLARLIGGADDDSFLLFRQGSYFGQFSEIDGGENAGDNDIVISSSGDFTLKAFTGIETVQGTLNTFTPDQAAGIEKFLNAVGVDEPPQVILKDASTAPRTMNFSGKADNGIALQTKLMVGGGNFTLTDNADTWIGNEAAAETINSGDGGDTIKIVWETVPEVKDEINTGSGDDLIDIQTDWVAAARGKLGLNAGTGTDRVVVSGQTGRLTGADIENVEELGVASKDDTVAADIAFYNRILSFFGGPQIEGAPQLSAAAAAQGNHITLIIEGVGGTLDVTSKAATLTAGWGVNIDASAATSKVILTGSTRNDKLTGSTFGDKLTGGKGNDTATGGAGKDKIDGKAGADTADYSDKSKAVAVTLKGASDATVKVGGKAEDTLKNVENVTGGSKADTLTGDSLANTFDGGLGKDKLSGAGGKDKFVFSTTLSAANVDTITGFKSGQDKIVLNADIFTAIGNKLEKSEFYAKDGATAAKDAQDRIIYDSKSGKLYYDADGPNGTAAVHFATLSGGPDLSFKDFAVV